MGRATQRRQSNTSAQRAGQQSREEGGALEELMGNGFLAELLSRGTLPDPTDVFDNAADGGAELPFRTELELLFGTDLSDVDVTLGQGEAMDALGAHAATDGDRIVFGSGSPDRRRVGEEVAHVIQARNGPSGSATVSSPGDAAEREARTAAGGGPVELAASPTVALMRSDDENASGAAISEPLDNFVEENEGTGECFAIEDDAHVLIDRFVTEAREAIEGWAAIRTSTDLRFDASALDQRHMQFLKDWMALESNLGPNDSPVSFQNTPEAVEEVRRRLNAGTIPQFVQEIRIFNNGALHGYAEVLGIEDSLVSHDYELLTTFGISGGGGEALVGEVALNFYEVRYSNSLGMSWSQSTTCLSGGVGLGVSTVPVSVNMSSSLGKAQMNAGSRSSIEYFGPEFFDGAAITYTNAEALTGGGVAVGALSFTNLDRTFTFDTSGMIVRAGTDDVGAASGTLGAGVCGSPSTDEGISLGDVKSVAEESNDGEWEALIEAGVFFPTGDAALDGDDIQTVQDVVRAIVRHEQGSPGDVFRIAVVGSASNRWRGDTGEATPEELNEAVATDRASAVRAALEVELGELAHEFTDGVFDESIMADLVRSSSSADPDDNSQIDRSVYIAVYYNGCGEGGKVFP